MFIDGGPGQSAILDVADSHAGDRLLFEPSRSFLVERVLELGFRGSGLSLAGGDGQDCEVERAEWSQTDPFHQQTARREYVSSTVEVSPRGDSRYRASFLKSEETSPP